MIGEGLEADTQAVVIPSHQHREPAHLVPGGDDAVGEQKQYGAGAVDDLLGMADAVDQVILLVDEGGGQLGVVDLARGHGHELMAGAGEGILHQFLGVVDDAHCGDGEEPQVGAHQQGLGIGIGDTADARAAAEFSQIGLKLGAEGGVLNVVNLALEAPGSVVEHHAAPAVAQVGMIVGTEIDVINAIFAGNRPEKATHRVYPPWNQVKSGETVPYVCIASKREEQIVVCRSVLEMSELHCRGAIHGSRR